MADIIQMKSDKVRLFAKIRMCVKSLVKGGDKMSEIRKKLEDTLNGVLDGKIPLDTAEQVHLVAHRHVMDRYADDREARRVGEKEVAEKLQKAQEMIKKM